MVLGAFILSSLWKINSPLNIQLIRLSDVYEVKNLGFYDVTSRKFLILRRGIRIYTGQSFVNYIEYLIGRTPRLLSPLMCDSAHVNDKRQSRKKRWPDINTTATATYSTSLFRLLANGNLTFLPLSTPGELEAR